MGLTAPLRFGVSDASGVAPVRRAALRLSVGLGFSEEDSGRVALVATELATNVIRHAEEGEVVLRSLPAGEISIVAWDRGPGIPDVDESLQDGYSTVGGSGIGLGAVRRMSDHFDLHSREHGTVAVARIGTGVQGRPADGLALAVAPETVCGDAWAAVEAPNGASLLLADGLGHGPGAAEASERAAAGLRPDEDVLRTLERIHSALRPTRGAAVAIARVDLGRGMLQFTGAGNISAMLWSRDDVRSLTSLSGTAGRQVKTARAFDYELPDHGFVILHSDGVRGGFDPRRDPALRHRDPLTIAASIVRDWERGRDDVSAVVMPVGRT